MLLKGSRSDVIKTRQYDYNIVRILPKILSGYINADIVGK